MTFEDYLRGVERQDAVIGCGVGLTTDGAAAVLVMVDSASGKAIVWRVDGHWITLDSIQKAEELAENVEIKTGMLQ